MEAVVICNALVFSCKSVIGGSREIQLCSWIIRFSMNNLLKLSTSMKLYYYNLYVLMYWWFLQNFSQRDTTNSTTAVIIRMTQRSPFSNPSRIGDESFFPHFTLLKSNEIRYFLVISISILSLLRYLFAKRKFLQPPKPRHIWSLLTRESPTKNKYFIIWHFTDIEIMMYLLDLWLSLLQSLRRLGQHYYMQTPWWSTLY